MKRIENGYMECYFLLEDGRLYNAETKEYREPDKENRFSLKTIEGKRKRIS